MLLDLFTRFGIIIALILELFWPGLVSGSSIPDRSDDRMAPGPSAQLYKAHFYVCLRNYYVATSGNNMSPGTAAQPWRTIQYADSAGSGRKAGDCINVAPGTYLGAILNLRGGDSPTSSGYVAYRCQGLDACHILAERPGHLWGIRQPANFVIIDGFELDGNNSAKTDGLADTCVGSDGDTYGVGNSSHHIWILNNIIHHCNLAGIAFSNKEWYYAIHNTVYHNSWTSGYQGSGIGFVVVQCIEAGNVNCYSGNNSSGGNGTYIPSGMDLSFAPPFHILVEYNDVNHNEIAPTNPVRCGSHTDGNGIIMDTFYDESTATLLFPYQTLLLGNVAYANGGRGIHVFKASNVTVANNTAYGNDTDTCLAAYAIGDLSNIGGTNNVWINNIAWAINTANNPRQCTYCGGSNYPMNAGSIASRYAITSAHNVYSNNIIYQSGPPALFGGFGAGQAAMFQAESISWNCSLNRCNTNPAFQSPDTGNFTPKPGSPAIGYGLLERYLPLSAVDAGACNHALAKCP